MVVGFDCRVRSDRKARWPAYKAQRPDKPPSLEALLEELPAVLAQLGGYSVCIEGCEADDVVGSAATAAEAAGWRCAVATSDRDAFALVTPRTTVLRLRSGMVNAVVVDERRIRREVGIAPAQYTEYARPARRHLRQPARGSPASALGARSSCCAPTPTSPPPPRTPSAAAACSAPTPGRPCSTTWPAPTRRSAATSTSCSIRRDLPVDLDRGRPRTPPEQIEGVLRPRRLAGLIARMTLVFGDVRDAAPPVGDADAPPF